MEEKKTRGQIIKERYGEDFYKKIGVLGGKSVTGEGSKGFAKMSETRHKTVSSRGGSVGRQPKYPE